MVSDHSCSAINQLCGKKNPKTDVLVQNKWDIEGSRNGECRKEVTVVLDCFVSLPENS